MQNLAIRNFANKANLLVPDTTKRRLLLPAIIGIALGSYLQQSLAEDVSPMTVFNSKHAANVARAVSTFNEDVMIDVNAAQAAAQSIYLVRNRILNGKPCVYSSMPDVNFMSAVFGFATVVPMDVYAAIQEDSVSSTKLYQLALLLVDELKAANVIAL